MRTLAVFGSVAASMVALPAMAEPAKMLTPGLYKRECLMCHSRAAPEGVSPEILAGLHPVPGLKPRDAMPNMECWRRIILPAPKPPADDVE